MAFLDELPQDYRKSPAVVEIQNALEKIYSQAEADIDELREQFFLSTATWGLSLWEWILGIETESGKDTAQRRSVILAKLRGRGTTTVAMLQDVSKSFVNGETEIVEHNDAYYFDVVMLSVIGIPPNMEDLKQVLEEIKPAHLDYRIVLKYNTWGMVAENGRRWSDIAKRKWSEVREVKF